MEECTRDIRELLNELVIKRGRIDSIQRQYSKNALDFQRPCAATISGGVPRNKSSVAPPIRKQCPVSRGRPADAQTLLQRVMNQVRVMGDQPSGVSNAKKGA